MLNSIKSVIVKNSTNAFKIIQTYSKKKNCKVTVAAIPASGNNFTQKATVELEPLDETGRGKMDYETLTREVPMHPIFTSTPPAEQASVPTDPWGHAYHVLYKKLCWDLFDRSAVESGQVEVLDYLWMATLAFLTGGYVRMTILFFVLIVSTSKLIFLLRKLLTNSKTKDLFFLVYLIACGCILGQCAMLITADTSQAIHEEGIILAYVYTTAVLMLFLIFLALTTCESYMDQDKKKKEDPEKTNVIRLIAGLSFVISVTLFYFSVIVEASETYKIKQDVTNQLLTNKEFMEKYQTEKKEIKPFGDANVSELYLTYEDNIINSNGGGYDKDFGVSKHWSIFDSLKFDILDTHKEYIMSAILQTATLVLVILSLIL